MTTLTEKLEAWGKKYNHDPYSAAMHDLVNIVAEHIHEVEMKHVTDINVITKNHQETVKELQDIIDKNKEND